MIKPSIKLSIKHIEEFRECVTENDYLILNNEPYRKKWNILCACMDRIEDIAKYLNSKVLGENNNSGCAFDLIEFLSHSASMLDCIETIVEALDAKNKIVIPAIVFKEKAITNPEKLTKKLANIKREKPYKNEDDLYFEYIRSIGVIHPNSTDRHPYFQQHDKEVSPFLIWNKSPNLKDGDISLHIYDSNGKDEICSLKLHLLEIYEYIGIRYNRITTLTNIFQAQIKDLISKLKSQKILPRRYFKSYNDYLASLKAEANKRSEHIEYLIEYTAKMLNLNGIPKEISPKYSKYCNALRFSIESLREILQSPILEKNYNEEILNEKLHLPRILDIDGTNTTSYYYGKAIRLYDEDKYEKGEIEWYRVLAKMLYETVEEYAPVNDKILDHLNNLQFLAVLNTALYFYSLVHDTPINKMIPKTITYRQPQLP